MSPIADISPYVRLAEADSTVRLIGLTRGHVCLVDVTDFNWLNQYRWQLQKNSKKGALYASRGDYSTGRLRGLSMHREILGLERGDPRQADHINGDGLDNRRSNLRIATNSQNQMNKGLLCRNTSGHKGVCWDRKKRKYRVAICIDRHVIHLGYFPADQLDRAAAAYQKAALELHGEYARLA
jgi:HNH endonuclease